MKARLFLDEDVHMLLAEALRKRGHDVIHAREVNRESLSDESQLNFATEGNRCIVTFNVGDFVRLHNQWMSVGREHTGIIVSRQLPIGECLRRLLLLLQNEDSETLRGQVRFL